MNMKKLSACIFCVAFLLTHISCGPGISIVKEIESDKAGRAWESKSYQVFEYPFDEYTIRVHFNDITLFFSMAYCCLLPVVDFGEDDFTVFFSVYEKGEAINTNFLKLSKEFIELNVDAITLVPIDFTEFNNFYTFDFDLSKIKHKNVSLRFKEHIDIISKDKSVNKRTIILPPLDVKLKRKLGFGFGIPGHYDDAFQLPLF